MRSEWFHAQRSAEDFMRMQEKDLDEKVRLTKLKLITFTTIFVLMYLFSELVFSIYRAPEYVVYDKVTGKRMVVSERQLETLQEEQVRKFNQQRRQNNDNQALQNELNRLIHEQGRGRGSGRPGN